MTMSARPSRIGWTGGDIAAVVLVVAVRIDDQVGAEHQAAVDARGKGMAQAAIAAEAENVVGPVLLGHFGRAVAAAVVDHQDFDPIDAGNRPRNRP